MNKKKFLTLGIHAVFCSLLIYGFYTYSFCRPYAFYHPKKELVSAFLVLVLAYSNYFFIVPWLLRKSRYISYFLLSVMVLAVVSTIELAIVKTDIIQCIGWQDESFNINNYLLGIQFIVFVRNLCIYLFFTVLKLYLQTKKDALLEKKEVLKSTGLVTLPAVRRKPISVNINFVSYFSQNKNNTYIHSITGKPSMIYSSLSSIQSYLEECCLRINRDTIITFTNVVSYNKDSVTVKEGKKKTNKSLFFFKNNPLAVYATLQEKLPLLEEKNEEIIPKNDLFGGFKNEKEDEKDQNGGFNNLILDVIQKNSGITAIEMVEIFKGKVSLRTLERRLKILKEEGLIRSQRGKNGGGYYLV